MNVQVVNQPAIRVASVRHIGAYTEVSEAFERLGPIAAEAGLFAPGVVMLGLYHDDPRTTPEAKLRSDAAISLREGAQAPAGTIEQTVPAGSYAKLTYTGPYTGLPDAWQELMAGVPTQGAQPADGVSYELYVNDPTDTAPEDLVTEIYVTVRRAGGAG